jgi:long-chain acyl-CoA synthetase
LKGEIAAAYIVLKPGAEASEQDIETHCRKLLAAYKIPRRIRFVHDLPKTSTGKILRRALAEIDPL